MCSNLLIRTVTHTHTHIHEMEMRSRETVSRVVYVCVNCVWVYYGGKGAVSGNGSSRSDEQDGGGGGVGSLQTKFRSPANNLDVAANRGPPRPPHSVRPPPFHLTNLYVYHSRVIARRIIYYISRTHLHNIYAYLIHMCIKYVIRTYVCMGVSTKPST